MNIISRVNVQKLNLSQFLPDCQNRDLIDKFAKAYFTDVHGYFIRRYSGHKFEDYFLKELETCVSVTAAILMSIESGALDLSETTALDVGCGRGLKSFPIARLFKQYIGVDIEREAIEEARSISRDLNFNNLSFFCDNAANVVKHPEWYGISGKIDFLFLNGVLEHFTQDERVAVFELMRIVKSSGGSVVVLTQQNRLFPFDHHSSELHFVDTLPDSLALRYIQKKSKREYAQCLVAERNAKGPNLSSDPSGNFRESVLFAEKDPITRLYRLGRGLSYHDFELDYYDDPNDFRPSVDGFHPALLNFQPTTRCEMYLTDYFRYNDLNVHRLFARTWLDIFDLVRVSKSPPKHVTLIYPRLVGEGVVTVRHEFWSLDDYLAANQGSLVFDLSAEKTINSFVLLLDSTGNNDTVFISAAGVCLHELSMKELKLSRPPMWHDQFAFPVKVPKDCKEIVVSTKGGSQVFSHGALVD